LSLSGRKASENEFEKDVLDRFEKESARKRFLWTSHFFRGIDQAKEKSGKRFLRPDLGFLPL